VAGNLERFKGEFLAQNIFLTEEAAFNDAKAFDSTSGRVFKPAMIKEIGGYRVAVIGQAFPYVPIAHPKRFTPDWTFGIRDDELQKLVDALRGNDKVDAIMAWMSTSSLPAAYAASTSFWAATPTTPSRNRLP
jgi:sulfur-oxidizing protein SoxB